MRRANDAGATLADCSESKAKPQRISIGKPEVRLETVPDNEHWYEIKLPKGGMQDAHLEVTLNALGVMTKADASRVDRKLETAVEVVKIGASIAGSLVPLAIFSQPTSKENLAVLTKGLSKPVIPPKEIPATHVSRITSLLGNLETLNAALLNLNTPAFGQARLDTLKFQQQNIQDRIARIKELLSGYNTEVFNVVLYVDPDTVGSDIALMRVATGNTGAEVLKVLESSSWNMVQYFEGKIEGAKKEEMGRSDAPRTLSLYLTKGTKGFNTSACMESARGYRYRIPGWAQLQITSGGKLLLSERVQIAQFGQVASLPETFSSADTIVQLELFEQTGAIHKIKVANKATLVGQVQALGIAGQAMLDAASTIRASSSETARLKDEVEQLEYRKKKLQLQEEINSLLQQ